MFTQYDKAGAAALTGAVMTAIAVFYPMTAEMQGAISTLLGTFMVWLVANKGA